MRAKICDRCGDFYNPYKYIPEMRLAGLSKTASNYTKPFDLCRKCEKELIEWFKEKGHSPDER